jgi:hypothetical protein
MTKSSARFAPRIAITAALSIAALTGAGFAVANAAGKADSPQRETVSQAAPALKAAAKAAAAPGSDAGRPAPPAPAGLRKVDWKNVTLKLPRLQAGKYCGGGTVSFKNGYAGSGWGRYQILPYKAAPAFGHLVGDAREDAAVLVACGPESPDHLVTVTGTKAKLTVVAVVSSEHWGVGYRAYRITGKKTLEVTAKETLSRKPRTQLRTFAWVRGAMRQVNGPREFPPPVNGGNYDWANATLTIPFQAATTTVQPNDRTCPRVTVTFQRVHQHEGAVQSGGCEYWIKRVAVSDLDMDGTADALVKITATKMGVSDLTTGAEWYFAYKFGNGKPELLGFVTAAGLDNRDDNLAPDVTAKSVQVAGPDIHVNQVFRVDGKVVQTEIRTWFWNGKRFVVNFPAPNPRADVAP